MLAAFFFQKKNIRSTGSEGTKGDVGLENILCCVFLLSRLSPNMLMVGGDPGSNSWVRTRSPAEWAAWVLRRRRISCLRRLCRGPQARSGCQTVPVLDLRAGACGGLTSALHEKELAKEKEMEKGKEKVREKAQ